MSKFKRVYDKYDLFDVIKGLELLGADYSITSVKEEVPVSVFRKKEKRHWIVYVHEV